jgi:hypothetical protein
MEETSSQPQKRLLPGPDGPCLFPAKKKPVSAMHLEDSYQEFSCRRPCRDQGTRSYRPCHRLGDRRMVASVGPIGGGEAFRLMSRAPCSSAC